MSVEDEILDRLAVSTTQFPNVYWIGRRAHRLTFLSQQQRALNLVWALTQKKKIWPGAEVTIVGAGLAGMTAAFAAHLVAREIGAKVTLIEEMSKPLHLQRGCQLRMLHPTIIEWPEPVADEAMTHLPFFNWGAGTAAQVCNTILEQWKQVEASIKPRYGERVCKVTMAAGKRPKIMVERDGLCRPPEGCDCLILAVGFGLEQPQPRLPFYSYWENDNFARSPIRRPTTRRYLVTGCGDGGLIDAARLTIQDFDHVEIVYQWSHTPDLKPTKERLREIDQEIMEQLNTNSATLQRIEQEATRYGGNLDNARKHVESELIFEEYEKLPGLEHLDMNLLIREPRQDTIVYLNARRPHPLGLDSSVLNRFVVYLLLRSGRLTYQTGDLGKVVPIAYGDSGTPVVGRNATDRLHPTNRRYRT